MSDHRLSPTQISEFISEAPPYQMADPETCIDLLDHHPNRAIIDTRPDDEFNNKASMDHANLGRMKGSIHLSSPDSLENIILQKDRSTLFLVYGSGSDTGAIVCRELIKKGFPACLFTQPGTVSFCMVHCQH